MGYGLIDAHTHLMFASLPSLAMIANDDSSLVQIAIQNTTTLNTRNYRILASASTAERHQPHHPTSPDSE
jgi:imidazolonepropionase-like amidohydrolase